MTRKSLVISPLLVVALLLVLGCARTGVSDLAGRWEAKTESGVVVLILNEDGKGAWRTEMDEVTFRWSVRDGRLMLHAKSGGVVAAALPVEGRLELDLPSVGTLRFTRVERGK